MAPKKKTQWELGAATARALSQAQITELEAKVKDLLFVVKEVYQKRLAQKPSPVEWLEAQMKKRLHSDLWKVAELSDLFQEAKQKERDRNPAAQP